MQPGTVDPNKHSYPITAQDKSSSDGDSWNTSSAPFYGQLSRHPHPILVLSSAGVGFIGTSALLRSLPPVYPRIVNWFFYLLNVKDHV